MTSLSETSLLAGAAGQSTGYEIDQSIRFNDDDSAYMHRTPSSGGNQKTFTYSAWIKLGNLGINRWLPFPNVAQSANYGLYLTSSDILNIFIYYTGSAWQGQLYPTQVFRDPSAWYHFVLVVDTTEDVTEERIRFYVNGTRVTSFSTENYPNQNQDTDFNKASEKMWLASASGSAGTFFDGYAAEIHWLDGYAYGPEYFGELKENTDIWIPKEYTGSYGTNGFKIDGRDSSDLGDDESGQGNDFTTSGLAAHDQVLDTPTNNFCTLTPLAALLGGTLVNGNLKTNLSGDDQFHANFDITEKTYCEVRLDATSNYGGAVGFGTFGGSDDDDNTLTFSTQYNSGQINLGNGGVDGNVGGTVSVGDIIMMALDPSTRKWWVGVNGTWRNSGDPGAGSGQVYQYSTTYFTHGTYSDYGGTGALVWGGWKGAANGMTVTWNFGQDSTFGGQETAGSNTDGSGNGSFKYAVPSGFNALCTKSMGS